MSFLNHEAQAEVWYIILFRLGTEKIDLNFGNLMLPGKTFQMTIWKNGHRNETTPLFREIKI